MEHFKVTQWRVKVAGENEAMFTTFFRGLAVQDREQAMAIAVATFGEHVEELEDEGIIHVKLEAKHLHIVDPRFCGECEGYCEHGIGCQAAYEYSGEVYDA